MKPISFISEHTAEYVLVPRLVSILSVESSRIVPFYFWATREGGSLARSVPPFWTQLVTVFARRPKVVSGKGDRVLIKVNCELFEAASVALSLGIPVLAGVPLVSSICDLTLAAPCAWFGLVPAHATPEDVEIEITCDGLAVSMPRCESGVTGPLSSDGLVDMVRQSAMPMMWDEAIERIREIRRVGGRGFLGIGTYRPFHLMLVADD